MKKNISIIICLLTLGMMYSQNYVQQGDELFAQSQYEKAIKKYNAAIEMTGSSSSISQKIDVAQKCQLILNQALQAEEQNDWEKAASLYTKLYELHPLSTYKAKANGYHQRIVAQQKEEQARKDAELAAQQKRIAEEKAKKATEEATRQKRIAEEKAKKQEEANKSTIDVTVKNDEGDEDRRVYVYQYDKNNILIRESNQSGYFNDYFPAKKHSSYRFQIKCDGYLSIDTIISTGDYDRKIVIVALQLPPLKLEHGPNDVSVIDLICHPMGIKKLSWDDSKEKTFKYLLQKYPEFKYYAASGELVSHSISSDSNIPTYYGHKIAYLRLGGLGGSVTYRFKTSGRNVRLFKQLKEEIASLNLPKVNSWVNYNGSYYLFVVKIPEIYGRCDCVQLEIFKSRQP